MKPILLLFTCAFVIYKADSASEKCYTKIEECHTTNYQEYVNCIRSRQKRSTDCDSPCDSDNCINTCNECDCSSCSYSTCQNSCNSCCSTCCSNYNVCNNNHCCHKTCHTQCRSSSCRSSCRKNCYERIKNLDEQAISNTNSNANSSSFNENKPNITTIIHLNNVINNTNVIDIPILLNNTNHNNITLFERSGHSSSSNESQNCCTVISPRQCVPQNEPPYVKCFHYRSRQCGSYCTAPIVHKEQQQICQTTFPGSAPSCQQSVIYIPQPQPRCTYQSTWPYVYCGIPKPASCPGCYSHYVNPNAQDYINCPSSCYDEGFGVGPYYRQGPFYRPTYTHAPCPTCFGNGEYGASYGPPPYAPSYGGYAPSYGGYAPSYGGYAPSYAAPYGGYSGFGGLPSYSGYPGYGGGYPPVAGYPSVVPGAGFSDAGAMSYGSWVPDVENNYEQVNNTSNLSFNPLFSTDPNLLPNPLTDRVNRELEIEVNFEPKSPDARAEVKIKSDASEEEKLNETETNSSTERIAKIP